MRDSKLMIVWENGCTDAAWTLRGLLSTKEPETKLGSAYVVENGKCSLAVHVRGL